MDKINISAIQFNQYWESKQKNLDKIESLFKEVTADTDIIVLPEMFSTSFTMDVNSCAENFHSSRTIKWMCTHANQLDTAICGSLIIEDGGCYFNRFIFAEPNGKIMFYDKRHLFTMANEDSVFSKGTKQVIIEYKGWKILPQVCYDLRFPVWSRNTSNYDLCIYVANWPKPRIHVWDVLLQARAIENQAYVLGCNRVGSDVNGLEYTGSTQAIDPKGMIISKKTNVEGIMSICISKTERIKFKQKFDVLADADSFQFKQK